MDSDTAELTAGMDLAILATGMDILLMVTAMATDTTPLTDTAMEIVDDATNGFTRTMAADAAGAKGAAVLHFPFEQVVSVSAYGFGN